MKYEISEGTKEAKCKGCASVIFWVKTKNNKNMPCNLDGTPHWETCEKAKHFKTVKKRIEESQLKLF